MHLVNHQGQSLSVATRAAVEAAYAWALVEFPHIDPAQLAGWAEEVGKAIDARAEPVESPKRYAFAALHGKVREWFRNRASKEIVVGLGADLEKWAGVDGNVQRMMDRRIFFDQVKTKLNERDKEILVLLLQDITSPADVAKALGVSYAAGAKAIQRVKERIAATLRENQDHGAKPTRFYEIKI